MVFNTLHPGAPNGYVKQGFSIGTWNARSLFCSYDYDKMKRKIKILAKHLRGMDVCCVQESRGSWADIHRGGIKVQTFLRLGEQD